MMHVSLYDCTNATIQAQNQANNTPTSGVAMKLPTMGSRAGSLSLSQSVIRRTRRHDPYRMSLLAPEDSCECSSELLSSGCTPGTDAAVLDSWAEAYGVSSSESEQTTASRPSFNANATPFLSAAAAAFSGPSSPLSPASPTAAGGVRRSLFAAANRAAGAAAAAAGGSANSSVEGTASSVTATPVGKVYRDGRPVPVRRQASLVLRVQLRSGAAEFFAPDLSTLFGVDSVDTQELVGYYVLVEGDRGEDLGHIVSVQARFVGSGEEEELAGLAEADADAPPAARTMERAEKLAKVVRLATEMEVQLFAQLDHLEAEALEHCRSILPTLYHPAPLFSIEGATFQFDRKKLTFHYVSQQYVDFRELTRNLHARYKCRIWMDQVNRAPTATPAAAAAAAPAGSSNSNSNHHGHHHAHHGGGSAAGKRGGRGKK
ncbi:hypothetical protein STCU_09042 [Strigomonas culicis]|uniref:PSP1 C-terminal domain-containing protein n=1 Tax=Strigomonas culicis TaxID=28005 RepID=S9TUU9_9TRYP|nr:hypothetical protein STCU_09042 [Strigomonas culicis]|eukprot:EPY20333.1 hypothetical protein STCU_09042 [Strigomonas culicis]